MCNLYLMYFTRSDHDDFKTCGGQDKEITKMLPEDSDRLIPDSMKESFIPYDNGHPYEETSKKEKKQFSFGGMKKMKIIFIIFNFFLGSFKGKKFKSIIFHQQEHQQVIFQTLD